MSTPTGLSADQVMERLGRVDPAADDARLGMLMRHVCASLYPETAKRDAWQACLDVARVADDANRGAGRSRAMVEQILADGAVIVVHASEMRRYVENMIGKERGWAVLQACRVVTISRPSEVEQLYGARKPILVDHAFWTRVHPGVAMAVAEEVERGLKRAAA